MLPSTYSRLKLRWPLLSLSREQLIRRELCDGEFEAIEDYVEEVKDRIHGEIPCVGHFRNIKWPLTVATLAGIPVYTVAAAAAELEISHTSLNRRADEIPHFITASGRRMYLMGDLADARRLFVKAPSVRAKYPRKVSWVRCEHCGQRHRVYREAGSHENES